MVEQSNRSLAKLAFFNTFNISMDNLAPYTFMTYTGVSETAGHKGRNFIIKSADGHCSLHLTTLIDCNTLPDNRSEIPTPDVAQNHTHLKCITAKITTGPRCWHPFAAWSRYYSSTQGKGAVQQTSKCPICSKVSLRMGHCGWSVPWGSPHVLLQSEHYFWAHVNSKCIGELSSKVVLPCCGKAHCQQYRATNYWESTWNVETSA